MPEIISRREALAVGQRRFYTGKPCRYGHDSERYVTSGACITCVHPKLPAAALPEPLENYTLANGRNVSLISQDEANARGWRVFFTGLPCDRGHVAERYVKDGRCVLCFRKPKYGLDDAGWQPFASKNPLRVPPKTPLSLYEAIAAKLQEVIPDIVSELVRISDVAPHEPSETCLPYNLQNAVHIHTGRPEHIRGPFKLWYPFIPTSRGDVRPIWMLEAAYPHEVPWVEHQGHWYALQADGSTLHIVKPGHKMTDIYDYPRENLKT